MKLRTKKFEEWIIVEGDTPENKAEFLVHPLSPKEMSALLEKAKKIEWDKGQRFSEIDFYKFKIMKIFATIINWKGVEDENGEDIPCINTNKEMIYLSNPEFIDDILEKADAMYKNVQDDLEKEEKNLKTAQLGMETKQ